MNISQRGIDLIREFEGYHDRLPDGRCKAYQRAYNGKMDVPTIGYGSVDGVQMGMVWTEQQATLALLKELEQKSSAVLAMVTAQINQNQRDALISLAYNIGTGAFGKSTLLKKLNKGDFVGAQAEFMRWNKAGGAPVRGLSIRRAKEAALFAERVEEPEVASPSMPQSIDAPRDPWLTPGQKMGLGLSGGVAVPAVPEVVNSSLSNVGAWKTATETVGSFAKAAVSMPLAAAAVVSVIGGIWIFGPKIAAYLEGKS